MINEAKKLFLKKKNEYYTIQKDKLQKALCKLTFLIFIAFDIKNVKGIPDQSGAIGMMPSFVRYKKTLMNRRIVSNYKPNYS